MTGASAFVFGTAPASRRARLRIQQTMQGRKTRLRTPHWRNLKVSSIVLGVKVSCKQNFQYCKLTLYVPSRIRFVRSLMASTSSALTRSDPTMFPQPRPGHSDLNFHKHVFKGRFAGLNIKATFAAEGAGPLHDGVAQGPCAAIRTPLASRQS
jgi:hypothetical protein